MPFIRSPLRYPRGKSRAIPQIVPLVLDFKEYREPMVGGGSLFFKLKQMRRDRAYWINDFNYELYCFWKVAQERAQKLATAVRSVKEQTQDGKQLFYELLEQYGKGDEFERAMRFFILNRITFQVRSIQADILNMHLEVGLLTPQSMRWNGCLSS